MALDPLKFAVQITDEASEQLKQIKSDLDKLQNKDITINVSGNLGDFLNLFKDGLDVSKFDNLKKTISDAMTGIDSLNKAAKEGNFADYAGQINTAKEAVAALGNAIAGVNNVVGSNEGFQKFMVSIGEVVTRVDAALKQLNETSSAGAMSPQSKSIEKAKYELYQFDNLVKQAEQTSRLGKQFGDVDTSGLDKAIEKLQTYRAELKQISETGKGEKGRGFDKFALQAEYKEAVAEAKRLIGETETLETSQRRYNQMLQGTSDLMKRISSVQDTAKTLGVNDKTIGKFSEAYDFKKRLESLSESDKNNAHIIRELAAEYTRLSQSLSSAAKEQEKLNAAAEKEKKRKADDKLKEYQREETGIRRVIAATDEAIRLMSRLDSTGMRGLSLGLDVSKIDDARNKLQEFINRLDAFDKYADTHATTELIGNFNILRRSLVETAKAQEQLNSAQERANKKAETKAEQQAAKDAREARQEQEKWTESMRRAGVEITNLDVLLRKLSATEKAGAGLGIDISRLKDQISLIQRYLRILEGVASGGNRDWNAGAIMKGADRIAGELGLPNAIKLANEAASAVNKETKEIQKNQAEKQKAASSTNQLTAEEQRLAQALNQTAESAKGQSQVLSDLKSMAMQYLGVWGGQQFLHNIIEIGGQLEMQRMSIGAILQNQSQANDLFEKIKGLAVQSPFGVVELDQMTKQLTAYGFKYSELFDMTKRLADISAATGTGVDRLALALGHVRSEAALSGYTLRQFSMGNVPLLAKLSEKLGKTTQEIRKMVRAKEISYEDVEGVIKDLTNEGGMFYNMQETISQSVKARFKNVKDAMAIMYGEMAESGMGDVLKSIADALMEITKNWKDVATVVGTGAAMWAAHRVAVMAYTTTLGKTNAAVLASIASHNKQEASILSLASKYRVLTVTEQERLAAARKNIVVDKLRLLLGKTTKAELAARDAATKRLFLSDIQLAMSEKKLTIEELARLVALGKVTKAEALQIITNLQLADSEKMVAANTIMGTKRLGTFKMGLLAVGGAAKTAALALKSLIFNPAMLGMAAITALIELWQRNNAEMERAKELGNAIFEASQEGLKNTRTMMENTGINAYQADTNSKGEMVLRNLTKSFGTEQESSRTFLVKPEFDSATAQQIIDEWSQYIRDYAGTPNRILNQALLDEAGNVRTLEEQFNHLFNSVQNVANAQKAIVDIADAIQSAQEETGSGWLNEDLVEDFADYDSALKKYNKSIVMAYHEHSRAVKKGIDAARKADSTFAKNTEGMASYSEMLKELVENSKLYSSQAGKAFNEAAEENSGIISRLFANKSDLHLGAEVEAEKEFKVFKDNLKIMLEGLGQDVENLTPEMKQGLMSMFINKVLGQDKLGRMSKEAKDKFIKDFADFIGETIDDAEEITKKRLADWQKRAGEVFIVNQNIKVKTKTITSLHEFAEEVQKDLKEKQEYITKEASHIKQTLTIQTGIKFNMQKIDASELDRIIIQLAEKVKKLAREGHVDTAKSLLSVIQDELMPFRDVLKSIDENKKWLKQEGYPEKDPTKDKSKNKHDSKKSYKDPVAEEWKERIRLLKDANSLYKEWNKREGEDEALNRVRQQYGDIFEKWRTDKNVPWKDFKAEDIIEYRNYIQKIVDEAQKRYDSQRNDKAKNYGKEAEAVLREGKKLLDDIDRYDFDEKAKDFTAAATKSIEQLNKRWEIFKSTVDTTGDALLAAQLAGFGDAERGARTAAEAMRNELVKQLEQLGGSDLVAKIPLDIDLHEEEVRDIFLNAIPNADAVEDYKESINALIKRYQEWQKLQQKANSDDIGIYTKIIGLSSSYDAQLRKINKDLQEQLASISANPLLSSGQKASAGLMAKASADWKKMKLSADYANLHNRAVAMSAEEYEKAEKAIKDLIERLRLLGMMSPEEEISETKALDKAASERRQDVGGALSHFITGGAQGLKDYYQRLADAALENRSRYSAGSAEWKKADEEYKKNQERADAIDDEIAGIQATQAALDNLRKAASMLSDFFVAIAGESSNEGAALGSISGGALSGASSLSGFGPWGMAAGAILGGATAMIQEGDKATERAINKLRGDVQLIESDLGVILKQRERTLGYDTDNSYLRRLYNAQADLIGQFGSNADRFGNESQRKNATASWGSSIMRDYYQKLMDSSSSGYQSQYNALIEERANYLAILDEQNEKKNKSNEEIAETQKKIAELDDQIAYFAQDLAKELWSIDIKGWADQLSDALASAFENGENMAKAYRDTVTQIIQQMMQKMMQLAILEPMFERLQKQLFGENGKGGVFDPNNPKGSMSKVTAMIADFFGKGGEGEKAITASMEFMTAFQRGMQNAGLTVLNEASNTLSSSMQGTTEETSGLLAGYVNALRQDVSVNRILLTQFVSQMWPDYMDTFANQVTAVQNIDTNVQVIMTMMQMGNGAMFNEIAAMRSRIDNVVMGIDKFAVK